MIASSHVSLTTRWHRQLGGRSPHRNVVRPFAALGYLVNGAVVQGLIEVENLVLVALYDEPQDLGPLAVRLVGCNGARVPWGVHWGGVEHSLFYKDLRRCPRSGAVGLRVDANRERLLHLALQLDGDLGRHCRYPRPAHRQQLQLPRLWAGFRAGQAADVMADGPELAVHAQTTGQTAAELLAQSRRSYEGLVLFPLPWTSHHWREMVAVFADLAEFPCRQVFALEHWPDDLQGFREAAQFDFYHSRFRRGPLPLHQVENTTKDQVCD